MVSKVTSFPSPSELEIIIQHIFEGYIKTNEELD
jgi:hypothetical protein